MKTRIIILAIFLGPCFSFAPQRRGLRVSTKQWSSPFGPSRFTDPQKLFNEGTVVAQEAAAIVQDVGFGATFRRTVKGQRAIIETAADFLREAAGGGDSSPSISKVVELTRHLLSGDATRSAELLKGYLQSLPKDLAPRTLRKLFERLGATYIKLGQFIASSPTLFPGEYVLEFQKCLDQSPTVEFSTVRGVVEEELGRPIEEVFSSFDRTPLASASVAQVHAAVLRSSGAPVVVKVQKPGVEDTLKADLGFLAVASKVLEFLAPSLGRLSVANVAADLRVSMLGELDFTEEARNLEAFRLFLESQGLDEIARAPRPYPQFSGRRALTMERLFGTALVDLEGIKAYTSNPEQTLVNALNTWALSVVACDFFHADVHAGNLMVCEDGRVGFIE